MADDPTTPGGIVFVPQDPLATSVSNMTVSAIWPRASMTTRAVSCVVMEWTDTTQVLVDGVVVAALDVCYECGNDSMKTLGEALVAAGALTRFSYHVIPSRAPKAPEVK
jgi:hypothetical protein